MRLCQAREKGQDEADEARSASQQRMPKEAVMGTGRAGGELSAGARVDGKEQAAGRWVARRESRAGRIGGLARAR